MDMSGALVELFSSCKSVFLLCLSNTFTSSIIDVGDEAPQGP